MGRSEVEAAALCCAAAAHIAPSAWAGMCGPPAEALPAEEEPLTLVRGPLPLLRPTRNRKAPRRADESPEPAASVKKKSKEDKTPKILSL